MGRWMCKAGDHMNGWPAGRLMGQSGHQVDDWIGSMPCCEGAGAWPCRPPPPIELEQELSSIGGMASTVPRPAATLMGGDDETIHGGSMQDALLYR